MKPDTKVKTKTNSKALDIITQIATDGNSEKIKKFNKNVAKAKQRLELSRQIYQLRKAAGMTQEELARKIGTKKTAISRWERRGYTNYTSKTLQKIVNATGGVITVRVVSSKPKSKAATKNTTVS